MTKKKVTHSDASPNGNKAPSYLNFNVKEYAWKKDVDYRQQPELYKVGKGEQGVLICEPYKSMIGPLWRFKDPGVALKSAKAIYGLFLDFLESGDFVGADLSRKYLQMGYTRSRRYANYKGGKKYDKLNHYALLERGKNKKPNLLKYFILTGKRQMAIRIIKRLRWIGKKLMADNQVKI